MDRFESLSCGLFVHWGLYSLVGQGEWCKKWHGIPVEACRPLTEPFPAADFSGRELVAEIFSMAAARRTSFSFSA